MQIQRPRGAVCTASIMKSLSDAWPDSPMTRQALGFYEEEEPPAWTGVTNSSHTGGHFQRHDHPVAERNRVSSVRGWQARVMGVRLGWRRRMRLWG